MKNKLIKIWKDTFSSLKIRNFRVYFFAQAFSMTGTFMQGVAQSWLVLEMTHSGTMLGITVALQYLPMFIFGPWGGTIADRYSKYKILIFTKSIYTVMAIMLGLLVYFNAVQLWMLMVFALTMGLIYIIDSPASYSFIPDIVGDDNLKNAITLNAIVVNLSRVVGPALAGILIAVVGMAPCFLLNGISFLFIIGSILMMDRSLLRKPKLIEKNKGQILEGFQYVMSKPELLASAVMIAIIGTLTYEFPVSLALLAKNAFAGNVGGYAALTSAFGLGSALGGFLHASRKMAGSQTLVISATSFGFSVILAAIMPQLYFAVGMMTIVGICSIWFATFASTTLQLKSAPELRGRVMVIWAMFYLGSNAIGGPIIGYVGEVAGARWSLAVGGISALVAAGIGAIILQRKKIRTVALEENVV